MRITVISTAALSTPSYGYSGMERIAQNIARGLGERGHDVSVIAKNGSSPYTNGSGKFVGTDSEEDIPSWVMASGLDVWTQVFVDISHDKVLSVARPDLKTINCMQAMSLMGTGANIVLISYGQWREKFPQVKEAEVLYQSVDLNEMQFYAGPRDEYILYMGQLIPEKRIEWACQLAIETNTPLKIYGPGWGDPKYHELLRDYTKSGLVDIHSDIGGGEKLHIIQHAKALVHPVGANNWSEAGAIIILESLACGTPVIGTRNGCIPEYIREDNLNGTLCDSVDDMVVALKNIANISPLNCRQSVERFDYRLAAERWERLCQRVAEGERWNVK